MQAARNAVETIKETAANIGASAKSGLEKTKATIQEKTEMMSAQDQKEMDIATQKKQEKINQAEMDKQRARAYNAAAKLAALAGHTMQGYYNATGPGIGSPTINTTGPSIETATNNATGLRLENVAHSNTGLGTGTATYNTSGPRHDDVLPSSTGLENATYNTSGLGHDIVLLSSTRPRTATYNTSGPGHDNVLHSSTRPGPETATHPTNNDHGQMGANPTTIMHGHGPRHGGLTEDVVGLHPIETKSGVGTTAQTTIGAGSAPSSGPNLVE